MTSREENENGARAADATHAPFFVPSSLVRVDRQTGHDVQRATRRNTIVRLRLREVRLETGREAVGHRHLDSDAATEAQRTRRGTASARSAAEAKEGAQVHLVRHTVLRQVPQQASTNPIVREATATWAADLPGGVFLGDDRP